MGLREALPFVGGEDRSYPIVDMTLSDLCYVLSSERRRLVIMMIDEQPYDKSELAHEIAVLEHGAGYETDARKSVHVSLHQVHLPTLFEHGVIQDGFDTGGVRPARNHLAVLDALAELQQRVTHGGGTVRYNG